MGVYKMLNRRNFLISCGLAGLGLLIKRFPHDFKKENPNIFLISIDTFRRDHLGCYGYPINITPNIDNFSGDAIKFNEHYANAPSTCISHGSLFTSLIPSEHGASVHKPSLIKKGIKTLAWILYENGYHTMNINDGSQMSKIYGLWYGFEKSRASEWRDTQKNNLFDNTKIAKKWIDGLQKNFFLFLHTYHIHAGYYPNRNILKRFWDYDLASPMDITPEYLQRIHREEVKLSKEGLQHIINCYDAEIVEMDEAFGDFINFLKQRGIYDDSLIVLTSDHGEGFMEHGFLEHCELFDEVLKIPLIIKLPKNKRAKEQVEKVTQSLDIAPTILSYLGLDCPPYFQGVNILQDFQNNRVVISQRDSDGYPTQIRKGKEVINLEKWVEEGSGNDFKLTEEQTNQLKSLGYLNV
jgi:arylsulfatase A-like enzyme